MSSLRYCLIREKGVLVARKNIDKNDFRIGKSIFNQICFDKGLYEICLILQRVKQNKKPIFETKDKTDNWFK